MLVITNLFPVQMLKNTNIICYLGDKIPTNWTDIGFHSYCLWVEYILYFLNILIENSPKLIQKQADFCKYVGYHKSVSSSDAQKYQHYLLSRGQNTNQLDRLRLSFLLFMGRIYSLPFKYINRKKPVTCPEAG